jgi:hypothetical protein
VVTFRSIRIGTSAFNAAGWEGTFYPAGMKPAEYLTFYATQFDAVEVDSTFYRTPEVSTVRAGTRRRRLGPCSQRKYPGDHTREGASRLRSEDKKGAAAKSERSPTGMVGASKVGELL